MVAIGVWAQHRFAFDLDQVFAPARASPIGGRIASRSRLHLRGLCLPRSALEPADAAQQEGPALFASRNPGHRIYRRGVDRPLRRPGPALPGRQKDRRTVEFANCRLHRRTALRFWHHGAHRLARSVVDSSAGAGRLVRPFGILQPSLCAAHPPLSHSRRRLCPLWRAADHAGRRSGPGCCAFGGRRGGPFL